MIPGGDEARSTECAAALECFDRQLAGAVELRLVEAEVGPAAKRGADDPWCQQP